MKKIAVILVDWNGIEVTRECLRSLSFIDTSTEYEVQVLVVDNGSEDPLQPLLQEEYPNVIFFRSEKNLGFAGGNNIALRYSLENDFEYTVLLNNDTTVRQDFITYLFNAMEANTSIGIAQPKIFFQHSIRKLWNAGNLYYKWFGVTKTIGYGKKTLIEFCERKKMSWATGCCMMIRNSLFKKDGLSLLNEQYETYYEDVEFSFRVRKLGYLIYFIPNAIIYHIAGYSVNAKEENAEGRTFPHIVYLNSRNRIFFLRQFTPWYCFPSVFAYQFTYYILLICRFVLMKRYKKLKMVLLAIKDGIVKTYKDDQTRFSY
jgi:GT2 family glycosyltransferase